MGVGFWSLRLWATATTASSDAAATATTTTTATAGGRQRLFPMTELPDLRAAGEAPGAHGRVAVKPLIRCSLLSFRTFFS